MKRTLVLDLDSLQEGNSPETPEFKEVEAYFKEMFLYSWLGRVEGVPLKETLTHSLRKSGVILPDSHIEQLLEHLKKFTLGLLTDKEMETFDKFQNLKMLISKVSKK